MNATMSESSPTFLLIFYAFYFLFLGSMVLSALIPSIVAYFIEAFALYKLHGSWAENTPGWPGSLCAAFISESMFLPIWPVKSRSSCSPASW